MVTEVEELCRRAQEGCAILFSDTDLWYSLGPRRPASPPLPPSISGAR